MGHERLNHREARYPRRCLVFSSSQLAATGQKSAKGTITSMICRSVGSSPSIGDRPMLDQNASASLLFDFCTATRGKNVR